MYVCVFHEIWTELNLTDFYYSKLKSKMQNLCYINNMINKCKYREQCIDRRT